MFVNQNVFYINYPPQHKNKCFKESALYFFVNVYNIQAQMFFIQSYSISSFFPQPHQHFVFYFGSITVYCTLLFSLLQYYTVLHCVLNHCTILYCVLQYCIFNWCILQYFTFCMVMYCIIVYYNTMFYTVVHYYIIYLHYCTL